MKYDIQATSEFKKGYKAAKKRGRDIKHLENIIDKLASGEKLSEKYCDHQLIGNYRNFRECHVEPDWLLIYRIDSGKLVLVLAATGTHFDLFGK